MKGTMSMSRVMFGALVMWVSACGDGSLSVDGDASVGTVETESSLSSLQRRARGEAILSSARQEGLTNGFLLAGIAVAETGMAHCWSEATWACQGPASSSCGGGPVIAGAGDGPCWMREGGLGMFQFDGGTFDQTLARDGRGILTVEGNTKKAVEFTVDMVIRSRYISGVSNRAQALAWMNEVRPNGNNWNTWIKTVTHYYNGCVPGRCSVYGDRIRSYSTKAVALYDEFGHDFWYPQPTSDALPTQGMTFVGLPSAMGRDATFSVAAPSEVVSVEYVVDGVYPIGRRDARDDFRLDYRFSQTGERVIHAVGYDSSGQAVAGAARSLEVFEERAQLSLQGVGAAIERRATFSVLADSSVVSRVEYMVDARWEIGASESPADDFKVAYEFSQPGARLIEARAYDRAGELVGVTSHQVEVLGDTMNASGLIAPADGERTGQTVTFTSVFQEDVEFVVYRADRWELGTSGDRATNFALEYTFQQGGLRVIVASAFDRDGELIAEDQITIDVQVPGEATTSSAIDMTYYYQYFNRFEPSGTCGLTSAAMLMSNFGSALTPDELYQRYGKAKGQNPAGLADLYRREIGFGEYTYGGTRAMIKRQLDANRPVVIHGYFTGAGHIIVLAGYDEAGFIAYDPSGEWSRCNRCGYGGRTPTNGLGVKYTYEELDAGIIGADGDIWMSVGSDRAFSL